MDNNFEKIDFLERCSTDFAYKELNEYFDYIPMKDFYQELKKYLKDFYYNSKDAKFSFEDPKSKKQCWIFKSFDYSEYNLDWDEAMICLQAVYADYPLLFFSDLYKTGGIKDMNIISPVIDADCSRGEFRRFYTKMIEEDIVKCSNAIDTSKGKREIARMVYNYIRSNARYDNNKGTTNYVDIPSHSILGFVRNRAAVCQGFARTYEIFLNYLSIPTVSTKVNTKYGVHSCNFLFLEDENKWIMVDATQGVTSGNESGFDLPPNFYARQKRFYNELECYQYFTEYNKIWDKYLSKH